ncbi:hypothetical protein COMNV_01397 [Commensalibacter sp. Nvir]|nr:hypothetical protein COMNV_01397 [Commensalibacter sp. Nvir]
MVGAGLLALAFAWFLEDIWYMSPCGMCLLERWPYRLMVVFGIIAYFSKSRWIIGLILILILASLGLSFVHIGVEQGWWLSPLPECRMQMSTNQNIETQFANMPMRPSKPCDLPSYLFTWLPVSLTMMNGLYSLALLVIVLILLSSTRRTRKFYH